MGIIDTEKVTGFYDVEYSLNYYESEKRRAEKYVGGLINPDVDLNKKALNFVNPLISYYKTIKTKLPTSNDDASLDKFGHPGRFRFFNRHYMNLWKAVQNTVLYFYFHDRGENVSYKKIHNNLKIISSNFWKTYLLRDSIIHKNPYDYSIEDHIDIWADITKILVSKECSDWLKVKLDHSIRIIPHDIINEGGFGKVLRTIGGVMLFCISNLPEDMEEKDIKSAVFRSVKAGYYFGMMYPLIDDLLDSKKVLSQEEKIKFNKCISDFVAGNLTLNKDHMNLPLITEVKKCFQGLIDTLPKDLVKEAFNALHMLYLSQKEDGIKSFEGNYSDKDIYIPIIIKAAYTRIVAAILAKIKISEVFRERIFSQGLEMQLVDDFRDFPEDYANEQFTPFTYYISGKNNKKIANPMLVFLGSLDNTINNFNNSAQVKKMLAKRFSHGIKKHVINNGDTDLSSFFSMFSTGSVKLETIIQKIADNNTKINNLSVVITPVIKHLIKKKLQPSEE